MRVLRTSKGKQAVTEITLAMLLARKRTLEEICLGWGVYGSGIFTRGFGILSSFTAPVLVPDVAVVVEAIKINIFFVFCFEYVFICLITDR